SQLPRAPVVERDVGGGPCSTSGASAVGKHIRCRTVYFALEIAKPVTPKDIGKHCQTKRPVGDKAEYHQGDCGRGPGGTEQCRLRHLQQFLLWVEPNVAAEEKHG